MKKLKKKLLILKVKICFLVVLPAVIILLAVRTLETFLRIRLRRTACDIHDSGHSVVIRPVSQTSFKPEIVTSVSVKSRNELSQT